MIRRSFLTIVGLVTSTATAGCFSESTVEPEDGTAEPECRLRHEAVESAENYGDVRETYIFENLSADAQRVIEEVAASGNYTVTSQRNEPSEFQYRDTIAVYKIMYQNRTYTLLTYTDEGC